MQRFAFTLVVVLAVAASATADEAQPAASGAPAPPPDPLLERAKPQIERGDALYEAGDYGAALAEFERAYEALAGHERRVEALYNMALCEQRLFRYDRAMQYLRRYLEEAGEDAADRAAVEAAMETLEGLLGTLRIELVRPAGSRAEVWVDDRLAGEAPGDVLVPGGSHTVEVRAPGYEPEKREVRLPARAVRTLRIELRSLSSAGPSPTYFWVAGGATLATAAVGVAFGLYAKAESDAIDTREADPLEQLKLTEGDGDVAGRAALTADILFGASGLLAVTSAVLFFVVDWEAEEEAPISITTDGRRGMVLLRGRL